MTKTIKTISRTLRPHDDDSASDPYSDELDVTSPSILSTGSGDENDNSNPLADIQQIPFGVLSKAQDSLLENKESNSQKKRKRTVADEKLQELRLRLEELRQKRQKTEEFIKDKSSSALPQSSNSRTTVADETEDEHHECTDSSSDSEEEDDNSSDDNSQASESENEGNNQQKKRRSKHGPVEMSTKRQVGRFRTVIEPKKRIVRDPRFMSGVVDVVPEAAMKKRYAFLDQYRQSEMDEIRQVLKKDKVQSKMTAKQRRKLGSEQVQLSSREREEMVRTLTRMEDQERTKKERSLLEEVEKEHMRKEKELVKAGKKAAPFYLKKADIKRLALEKKFVGMKGKERDRAIERRRKKIAGKEKKAMPADRRTV